MKALGHRFTGTASSCAMQVLLCLVFTTGLRVSGAERRVWSLGTADRSDHEFGPAPAAAALARNVILQIDLRSAQHWPRFQPGAGNGMYGHGSQYTLEFELSEDTKTGVYYLDLDLLFRQPRVPALDLDVNDQRGRFYFDPHPMFELGAVEDEFNVIRSAQHRRISLSAGLFHSGTNRISFAAADDPMVLVTNRTVGATGDSGWNYDALSLSYDPDAQLSERLEIAIRPTVFYSRKPNGTVAEQCWLEARLPTGWPGGTAKVSIGKTRIDVPLAAAGAFGECRAEFFVPSDVAADQAHIELVPSNGSASAHQASDIPFRPAKKWKVFYAPNEHLDVGYTDYRAKVAELHARCMDQLLTTLTAHPGFRFNLDGSWVADAWLDSRTTNTARQLIPHTRAGRVGMNAFYCSVATEYPSLEENIRNLYLSKALERQYGIPFDYALVSDVPSVSASVPSVLAAAGIRYFANGGNQDRGPMIVHGHWNVRSPFWWEGPDGARVLTWFSAHYHQFKAVFGLPPAIASGTGGLARFLKAYELSGYSPDAVLLYGTEVENLPTEYDDAAFVERWNAQFAWPKLINCRFSEFFQYIEKSWGTNLPVVRGTGGSYWADNFGILAGATARDRANQTRALAAESFGALAASLDPKLQFPGQLDREIWKNLLLYAEHNFGIGGLNDRPDCDAAIGIVKEKEDQTVRAQWDIDRLLRRSLSQLAEMIRTDGQNLLVFNPLSWDRSGFVQVQLDQGIALTNMATGKLVDGEVLGVKDGVQTIRFWADDVPAVGYRVYRFGRAARVARPDADALDSSQQLENQFYRVTLDPERSAIASIYDKELGRELIDTNAEYHANEYLFVDGGGTESGRGRGAEDSRLMHPFDWLPEAQLTVHRPAHGRITEYQRTAWGQRARLTASALHTPHIETEILLPNAKKLIQICNRIQVDLLLSKQASYFAFPWALPGGRFRYDIPNGYIDPERDLLEGGCSDWFSVQSATVLENSEAAVTVAALDAPLVCLGDICRGKWLPQFTNCAPVIYSYALNNYWSPKWAGQKSADLQYRYVITSSRRFNAAETARIGREARSPLEPALVKSSDKLPGLRGTLPPGEAGFVKLSPSNVVLCALKPAEDGHGLVARILETAGQACEARLDLPLLQIDSASEANAVEVPGRTCQHDANGVRFQIGPNQVKTIRVTIRNR